VSGFGAWLFNLLTGGLPDKLIGAWQAHEAGKLAAMNDTAKREHEAMLQARADAKEVRLATANFWEMRLLTFAIAFPFVAHLWLVTYDTLWPQVWNVESFPSPFDEWEGAILLSFFGIAGGVGAVKAIAGAIAVRRKG
jgi:hypothetical protein